MLLLHYASVSQGPSDGLHFCSPPPSSLLDSVESCMGLKLKHGLSSTSKCGTQARPKPQIVEELVIHEYGDICKLLRGEVGC